jgi:NIPSNAP
MPKLSWRRWASPGSLLVVGIALGYGFHVVEDARAATSAHRVYELRTYTTSPGKIDALNARFRDNTLRLFVKHHMKSVAYWMPQDPPLAGTTLVYVISHDSREVANANWAEFMADPEVKEVMSKSEENGKIVTKVERVFMDPTDYSPLQ